jgi:hypothetical protein
VENVGDEWRDIDDMLITRFIPYAALLGVELHTPWTDGTRRNLVVGEEDREDGALWHRAYIRISRVSITMQRMYV